jgi:hypothetical protein
LRLILLSNTDGGIIVRIVITAYLSTRLKDSIKFWYWRVSSWRWWTLWARSWWRWTLWTRWS